MEFGEWVTISQAINALKRTYWQLDYVIRKNNITVEKVGQTRLIKLADLEEAVTRKKR